MTSISSLLLATSIAVASGQSNFRCPDPNGYFPDPKQCDKYYDCLDDEPEDRLCPDGLVFDPYSRKKEPCDHYFNVDCELRTELQPPRGPSELCPRLNGFYSHPDPGVCHIFYSCVEGNAESYSCSSGLWFDEYSGVCNWPEFTDRQDCRSDAYETKSGFQCPEKKPIDEFGQYDPHPKYADIEDCGKFYICLNGISPREQGCPLGEVYNEIEVKCDVPENVDECADYYKYPEDKASTSNRRRRK